MWRRTLGRRPGLWVGEAGLHGRSVALRLELDPQLSEGRAELEVLASVEHPGLARLAGHGRMPAGAGRWVAREWIEGRVLSDWARGRSAEELAAVVAALCDALDHVHERGFVHGDLKAGNVIVRAGGQPVLTDFGLAGRRAAPEVRARASGVQGSPFAIAPELLAGAGADERTDLFALGVMLYDLLQPIRVGGPEFYGSFPSRPFLEVVGARMEGLPTWARDLVEQLVASDPARRPASAAAVGRALRSRLGRRAAHPPAAPAGDRDLELRSASRIVLRWPTLLGREEFPGAQEPDAAPATPTSPACWWRAAAGEDLVALAEAVVVRDAIADRATRHLQLERSLDDVEREDALDRWARRALTAAAGERLVVTQLTPSLGSVRAIEVLRRSWRQVRGEAGPSELHVLASADPRGGGSGWTTRPVPTPSEADILGFLKQQLEGGDDPRLEQLAARLHAECQASSARLQELLEDLVHSGWLRWLGERPGLRPGPIPDWLGRTRARWLAEARGTIGHDEQRLLAALTLLGGRAKAECLSRVAEVTGEARTRALARLQRLGLLRFRGAQPGLEVELSEHSSAAFHLDLDARTWRALCLRSAEALGTAGAAERRLLPLRYRAEPSPSVRARIEALVEQYMGENRSELAVDLLLDLQAHARASGRSLEPELACSLAAALAAIGEVDRAEGVLAAQPADHPLAARARSSIARQRHDSARALQELERASAAGAADRAELELARAELLFEEGREAELGALLAELDARPLTGLTLRARVNLACVRAMHLFRGGGVKEPRAILGRSLEEARQAGDEHRQATVYLNLGTIARRQGALEEAAACFQRAHDLFEACGLVTGMARARLLLGGVRREQGELLQASELTLSAVEMRERLGDEIGAAAARGTLGMLWHERGHLRPALEELEASAARLAASNRRAEARLLEALAVELHARAGHAVELPDPQGPAAEGEDPRRGLALARAAWIAGCDGAASDWARRSLELAARLGRRADARAAERLLSDLATGESAAGPRRGSTDDDARVLALLLAEDARESALASLAEELEARGRDDRAARVWLALARRAASAEVRREARRRAQDRLDCCSAGLVERERESSRRFLLGRPDPCPTDLREARSPEEEDMDVLAVLDINHRLVEQRDLTGLLGEIVESALRLTGAERGFLVLEEDGRLVFDLALDSARGDIAEPELEVSRTVVRQALALGAALRLSNAGDHPLVGAAPSVSELELRSILVQPFAVRPGLRGVIYLDHRLRSGVFGERAERLLDLLSDQAALAIRQMRQLEEIRLLNEQLGHRVAVQETDLIAARRALERAGLPAPVGGLVGESDPMRRVHELLRRVAPTDLAVLVCGPSGSGKELAARAVHDLSGRSDGPFVSESCAALPASLIESELFGHVKGAFTGAEEDRQGLFERAHAGTLFLDEIGELPHDLQAKLLRVLETRQVRRLGQSDSVDVDFRLVVATNRDLAEEVAQGRFRSDLFYRLDAMCIEMPSLAERVQDIPALVDHFLRLERAQGGKPRRVAAPVLERLCRREWPGNVRELGNEVARLCVLSPGDLVDPELVRGAHGPGAAQHAGASSASRPEGELPTLAELERQAIFDALERTGGDKNQAARLLGISRAKIYQRLKEWRED